MAFAWLMAVAIASAIFFFPMAISLRGQLKICARMWRMTSPPPIIPLRR
jgi:hypothetical protein